MNKKHEVAYKRAIARRQIARANRVAALGANGLERLRKAGIVLDGNTILQGNHRIAALKVANHSADSQSKTQD